MSDIGTDGTRLYTSSIPTTVVNGVVQPEPYVVVGGLRTPIAPARLLGDRLAINPAGDVAVCARTAADRAYGSINFGPWVELGRTAQPVCVWWVDTKFVFAMVGLGGGTLIEQEIVGGQVWPVKSTSIPPPGTSTGLLYYDEGSREFVVATQTPLVVNGHTLYRAVRRLVEGRWIYHGQHVSYPKDVLYVAAEGVGFVSGPQKEIPQLIAIGSTLYTNGGAAWPPPYPANVPTPQPPPMPVIGRPHGHGYFEFVPAQLPGNWELKPTNETWQWGLWQGNKQIAVYVAGHPLDGNLAHLEESIRKVKPLGLTVIAYVPRGMQTAIRAGGRLPKGADVIAWESYRLKEDSLAKWEAEVRSGLALCPVPIICAQCYTSNAKHTTDLRSLVPVYAQIAKDTPHVLATMVFSGSGRPTGLQDHAEVKPLWQQFAAGIPSAPPIPEPEPPDPPPDPEDPVAFPTDAEFADFYTRLNGKYAGPDMNRPPIQPPSHVDPIGQGRWSYDYSLHRQAGHSHETAWQQVEDEINRILGIPPNP